MAKPSQKRTLAIFDSDRRGGATAAAAIVMAVLVVATMVVVSSSPTTYRAETNNHGDDYDAIKSGLENSIEEQGVQQDAATQTQDSDTDSTKTLGDTTKQVHKIHGDQGTARSSANPFNANSPSAKKAFVKRVVNKLPAQARSALSASPVFKDLDRSTQVGMTELLDSVANQQQASGEVTTVDPKEDATVYGSLVFIGASNSADALSLQQTLQKTWMVTETYMADPSYQWTEERQQPGAKWQLYSSETSQVDTKRTAARSKPDSDWSYDGFAYTRTSSTPEYRQVKVQDGYTTYKTVTRSRQVWHSGHWNYYSYITCSAYDTVYYPQYGISSTECVDWDTVSDRTWISGYYTTEYYDETVPVWHEPVYETQKYYPEYTYNYYTKPVYDTDYKYKLPSQQATRQVQETYLATEVTDVESNAVALPSQTGGVELLNNVEAARDGRLTVLRDSLPATKAKALTLTASEDSGAGTWWLKAWAPSNSTIKVQTSAMTSPAVIEDSKATIDLSQNTINGEQESIQFATGIDEAYSVSLTNSETVYGSLILLGKGQSKAASDTGAFSSIQTTDGIYSTEFTVTYQTQQTTYTDLIKVTPAYSDELTAADIQAENTTA